MKLNYSQRLRIAMAMADLNSISLSNESGVPASTIQKYMSGRRTPGELDLMDISESIFKKNREAGLWFVGDIPDCL